MLLDTAFLSRFRRANRTGLQAIAHLPVIAGQQFGDILRRQSGEAGGTGGDDRLVAFHQEMAQGVGPEMPGQLLAIAQLAQVVGVAERMAAVGIGAVGSPVVMHRRAREMGQIPAASIASAPRWGWTV